VGSKPFLYWLKDYFISHIPRPGANMGKNITTNEFINRAILIHGDKFGYDESIYINAKSKIKIFCKQCNTFFYQTPSHHIHSGQGCPKCSNRDMTTEKFIFRSTHIHGNKYDYTTSKYINAKTNIQIYCNTCKEHFYQTPDHHLNRRDGCPKCRSISNGISKRLSLNEIICRAKIANFDKYDYSITEYAKTHDKLRFICPIHGIVEQYTCHHLKGVGCPICRESKGENRIRLYLKQNNIQYQREKKFEQCVNIKPLSFDFYIPILNMCIEYDGEHHFQEILYNGKCIPLSVRKNRDNIKSKYCQDNNIKLLRIPYTEFNDIEDILKRELS